MNRLRTRLMLVFLAATLVPVAATLAVTWRLLEHSLSLNPTAELDEVSRSLEATGRALYRSACDAVRAEASTGHVRPAATYNAADSAEWPQDIRDFAEGDEQEMFRLTGANRDQVEYLVRNAGSVILYRKQIGGPGLKAVGDDYRRARATLDRVNARDLRRGYTITLVLLAAGVWVFSFAAVLVVARRITGPIEQLTAGLSQLATGNLDARLEPKGGHEVASAMAAFNYTARQLRESREKLVHVTRLESWQTLARKMAHEVKNSLTPIRLTMEEIIARKGERDEEFIEQAAQIVVEEVGTLQRRVRAFTDLASEPPVNPAVIELNGLLEDRITFLRSAHPEVSYKVELAPEPANALADHDLIKGVLTNLLENAAQAAGSGGTVLGRITASNGFVVVEVHDSGPGLSEQARKTLFEPTISFKKAGMGLGLSIAKRSAVATGGDIVLVEGELGGAAFRLLLPQAEENASTARTHS